MNSSAAENKATNITWHSGEVSREERYDLLGQKGATLWFTGLSASGKSTVAVALEQELLRRGKLAYRLDGDNVRHGINKNLGFSADDRQENIRRVSEVSKLFADSGLIVLSSFISPYRSDRRLCRDLHEEAGLSFLEVYVDCPIEVAEQRDPKGLYKKARAGEIKHFTGIDDPYEIPELAEIHLKTDKMSIDEEVEVIIAKLQEGGFVK